jgi:hypothetical protein
MATRYSLAICLIKKAFDNFLVIKGKKQLIQASLIRVTPENNFVLGKSSICVIVQKFVSFSFKIDEKDTKNY